MGHPVCLEIDGFDATIATRFGLSGLEISMDALLIARSPCDWLAPLKAGKASTIRTLVLGVTGINDI